MSIFHWELNIVLSLQTLSILALLTWLGQRGLGIVNCIYFNPKIELFWLIDYHTL